MQAEFDEIAENFDEWHQELISASGFSPDYFHEYKVKEIHRILSKHKSFQQPLSILDFGCGTGNTTPYLRKYFPSSQIYGADLSEESIKIAKNTRKEYNAAYATLQINSEGNVNIPFGKSFDLIFVSQVFHHIPKAEHKKSLSCISASMNPQALLFAFEMNPYNPASRHIFNKFEKPVDKNADMIYPHKLKKQMRSCGLQIIRHNYTIFFPKMLSFLIPFEKFLSKIPMGAHYYVMAKKGS